MFNTNNIQPERIEKIVEIANENKFVTVDYLCSFINASPSTIRRDLRYLEENGIVKRFHGGASILKHRYVPFSKREKLNTEEKNMIAIEAVKLVKDNSTIILDSGTTVQQVAFHLANQPLENLTIITPTIYTAQYLIDKTDFKILISGGLFNRESSNLLGMLAVETFNKLKSDIAIMSCETVAPNMDIMYPELEIIEVRRAVLGSASFKVLVVDSSKFDRFSLASIGEIDIFDVVVTDNRINEKHLNEIKKRNLKLIIANN
jgi:DeoR/GlpR family transcriptional regulator of sugar metabolism